MSNVAHVVTDRIRSLQEGVRDAAKNMQISVRLDAIDYQVVEFLAEQLHLSRGRCAATLVEASLHEALDALGYYLGTDGGVPAIFHANSDRVAEYLAPPGHHPDEDDA